MSQKEKVIEGRVAMLTVQPYGTASTISVYVDRDDRKPDDESTHCQLYIGWAFNETERPDYGYFVNGTRCAKPLDLLTRLLSADCFWRVKVTDEGGYVGCARAEFTAEPNTA